MCERFDDDARDAMMLANQEAQRLNHEYIGTEHILLGLAGRKRNPGVDVIATFGVTPREIRLEVEKIVQLGPDMITEAKLPQTPRAKKVVQYAYEEARLFDCPKVGTVHLLLGLLREEEGLAAQILLRFGVSLEKARRKIATLLEKEPTLKNMDDDWLIQQLCELAETNDPSMALICAIEAMTMIKELKSARARLQHLTGFMKRGE